MINIILLLNVVTIPNDYMLRFEEFYRKIEGEKEDRRRNWEF